VRPRSNVRWWIVFLAFLGTTVNYVDRANLSVAAPFLRRDLGISEEAMGLVLGAFFWTYALFQIPSGWFVDRFGPRLTYALAVIWWSAFTAAGALARGFRSLFGIRLLLGIGESAAYPTNVKVVSEWFPRHERAFATSIFDSGARVGTALSLPIVTAIIGALGWRAAFAATGAIGLVWAAAWVWIYRHPRRHTWASPEEVAYIEQGQSVATPAGDAAAGAANDVRLVDLLRHRTIWGMMLGFFCLSFVIYFFITWFPTYLVEARGFDLLKLGIYGAIPALVAVPGGYLGGLLSDRMVRRGVPLSRARKIPIVIGMSLSSVIALSVLVESATVALALLSLCYASLTFAAASVWSLPADVAPTPRHVGLIGGIQNLASNIAGFAIAAYVGVVRARTGSFVVPLVTAGACALVGALAYLTLVRVEPLKGAPPGQRPVS
jgi:D-galactonate transporter